MSSNNTISKIDPFSVKSIQFNVKKINKHTTIKSLIATLIIFTLTVIISFNSLQNLWVGKQDLPYSTQYQLIDTATSLPITRFPFCLQSNTPNAAMPQAIILDAKSNRIAQLSRTEVQKKYPALFQALKTSKYSCYDPSSTVSNYVNSTLYGGVTGNVTLLVQFDNFDSMIKGKKPIIYTYDWPFLNGQINLYLNLQKYVLYDKLSIDYQPQIIVVPGIANMLAQYQTGYAIVNRTNKAASFSIGQVSPFQYQFNQVQYQIYRQNIGQIFGKFFAYYSIILLAFLILIGPAVEFSLNIELTKSLYTHDYLNSLQSSIVVQLKYYISKICPGYFKERIIDNALERLEKDTDIINLLKKQIMMKRISKQLRFSENQIDIYVPDFEYDKTKQKELLQKQDSDDENEKKIKKLESQFIVKSEQKHQFFFLKWIQSFILWLDSSQVQVGLVYNKGNPTGSIWSIIVTILGIGCLATFLVLSGVISIQTSYFHYTQVIGRDDDTMENKIILKSSDFLLHGFSISIAPVKYTFQVRDDNFNLIKNYTLSQNNNCSYIKNKMIATYNPVSVPVQKWLCLLEGQNIEITNSKNKRIYFGFTYDFLTALKIPPNNFVFMNQVRFDHNIFSFHVNKANYLPGSQIQYSPINSINYIDQNQGEVFGFYGANQFLKTRKYINKGRGFFYYLNGAKNIIKKQASLIWDIIDSTWGIVIIVFQIIIIRVAKIINKRVKRGQTNTDRQRERTNIINILTNHDRLINGSFRKELNSVKYFFKQNLNIVDIGR